MTLKSYSGKGSKDIEDSLEYSLSFVRIMLYEVVLCKMKGDRFFLMSGVGRFFVRNYNLEGTFFAAVKRNYLGSYELLHYVEINKDTTIKEIVDSVESM